MLLLSKMCLCDVYISSMMCQQKFRKKSLMYHYSFESLSSLAFVQVLLMQEVLHTLGCKNPCTVNNGMFTILTGAGFVFPSTVCPVHVHQYIFVKGWCFMFPSSCHPKDPVQLVRFHPPCIRNQLHRDASCSAACQLPSLASRDHFIWKNIWNKWNLLSTSIKRI